MKKPDLKRNAPEIAKFLRQPHLYYLLSFLSVLWVLVNGIPWGNWRGAMSVDWMLVSGFSLLIVTVAFANTDRSRLEQMLDRLDRRGVLVLAGTNMEKIKRGLEERAGKFARFAVPLLVVSIVGVFVPQLRCRWRLCLFDTVWAFVVGESLGRIMSYGSMGWYLKDQHVTIRPVPGHIDGAAGLRPVGDFCLFQAMIIAAPAAYLAIWSLAIQASPVIGRRYSQWMHPYLGLLALAIGVEALAFVVPMWRFHLDMTAAKQRFLPEADSLGDAIAAIGTRLGEPTTHEEREALNQELSIKTKQYLDIEMMPTWPVDVVTFRHFLIRNAVLLLPLIAEGSGVHEAWVKLLEKAVSPDH